MTLHEAIEKVLKLYNRPMAAKEIADEINKRRLYIRGDGNPVPSSQIYARTKNYPSLFSKRNGLIVLNETDYKYLENKAELSIEEELKKMDIDLGKRLKLSDSERINLIGNLFLSTKGDESKEWTISNEIIKLPSHFPGRFTGGINAMVKNWSAISSNQLLLNNFTNLRNRLVHLPEYERLDIVKKYLEETGFFEKKSSGYYQTPQFINRLLVSLTNPQNDEVILDPAAGKCDTLIEAFKQSSGAIIIGQEINADVVEIGTLNFLVNNCKTYKLLHENSLISNSIEKESADVIISNPPFSARIEKSLDYKFPKISKDFLLDTVFFEMMLNKLKPKTGRMALVVTESFLNRTANYDLRKRIVHENQLDLVLTLPKGSFNPYTGISTSIIVINNRKTLRRQQTLFIDGSESVEFKLLNMELSVDTYKLNSFISEVIDLYEGKKQKSELVKARLVSILEIEKKSFNLSPNIYSSEIFEILKETQKIENIVELDQVLKRVKTDSYQKGELVLGPVTIKDLQNKSEEFYLNLSKLNKIDKEFPNLRTLKESALLISRIGDKLKPTYFEFTGKSIAINSNVVPFAINNNIINSEYLISELNSNFFTSQLELIRKGAAIPAITMESFLKLQVPLPPLSEQMNRLATYKEGLINKFKLTKFIKELKLVHTDDDIKSEIEKFAKKTFPDSELITFNNEFVYKGPNFTEDNILNGKYIKKSHEGNYTHLLLIDDNKKVNGILTIQGENEISQETYSDLNAYADFIIKASTEYIQQNTNKLLNDFSHTTKNILKDVSKILNDFITTNDKNLIEVMKNSYLKDDELIEHMVKSGERKKEDYLAYNRLKEAKEIINSHLNFFKRRHTYYTNSVNSEVENVQLSELIKRINNFPDRIEIKNNIEVDEVLTIKPAPIELAFKDLIENAINYSTDRNVFIEIFPSEHYIVFKIINKVKPSLSKKNYERLGKEDIKRDDGTFSTGLFNAFRSIMEDNFIILADYETYISNSTFEITIKLKKK